MTEENPKFRVNTIKALLDQALSEQNNGNKVRVANNVYDLVAEYLRCVVVEATERSSNVAGENGPIDETHFEKILPQLLLDIC